jgi:hypothetical protein
MPLVTIKTGLAAPNGHEETLTEYFCDWPGCTNVATEVLGCSKELGICSAVCKEHVAAH